MILLNVQVVVSQQARGAQGVKMNGTAKGNQSRTFSSCVVHYVNSCAHDKLLKVTS